MPDGTSSTLNEVKISELPVAPAVSDADQLEANQAGTSRSITIGQVKAAAVAAVPPPPGFLYAGAFGVVIGTTADQSVALQAAIDAAEAQKLKLVLPAGYIRIDSTIVLGWNDPVWVEGQQAHSFYSFGGNQVDDVTVLYCANLPSNVPAVKMEAASDTRDGITLKNVTIYRPTASTAGAGDKGIWIRGTTKACLEDIVIRGFDVGLHCDINSDGSRSTYLGNFRNIRIDASGAYGGLISCCVDCLFDHCAFGSATVASMALVAAGAGTYLSNGNYWEHCTFIGSVSSTPVNSVRVDVGFWNTFDTCALEQASGENFKADYSVVGAASGHSVDRVDVVLVNCWLNNGATGNTGMINLKDVNFEIIGGRAGSTVSTDASIKINKSFFNVTTFDSCIMGMQIEYQAVAGIAIDAVDGIRIIGCGIYDHSAGGLPCVTLGSNGGRHVISANRFKTTHARGYTDADELTGGGSVFRDNVLTNNTTSDSWSSPKAINGPVLAFDGQTPRISEYGLSQAGASRLYARYTADASGVFHYWYKTRQATPGGARVTVQAADTVALHRFYADDGTADPEVARLTVAVDAIAAFAGGSWEVRTRSSTTGTLSSRLKIDNLGAVTVAGNVVNTNGTYNYTGTATGTDTIVVNMTPAIAAYVTGCIYVIRAGGTNTLTNPTLNINGLGAKTIVKRAATVLAAGDIQNAMMCLYAYNGNANTMQLLNPVVP